MKKDLKASSQRIQDILHQKNIETNVIEFNQLTRTAQEAADTIGCAVAQIAKTLIFKGKKSGNAVCIIASGINTVDEKKIAAIIGEKIEKADPTFVRANTGFAIGGIPPIGYTLNVKPLIDEDLTQHTQIWAAAGTPQAVFNITPKHLLELTNGVVADIKK